MATQQGAPSRPWFSLATMARPPPSAPAPPPPPEQTPAPPRPAFIRPAFRAPLAAPPPQPPATNGAPPASSPTSPKPQPPATNGAPPTSSPTPPQPQPLVARATPSPSRASPSPSPSPPTQPQRQSGPPSPVTTSPKPHARSLSFMATMAPTPTPSPQKTLKPLEKNSPRSPTINSISRPPSPLALPSPQLKSYHPEYEQKSVLVQETKEKPKSLDNGFPRYTSWGPKNPKRDTSKIPETFKKHSDSEDSGMRIITIAGENKGAIMDLTPFGKKTHNFGNNLHSLQNNKDNPTASSDGEKSGSSSDGKSKAKNKNSNSPLVSAVMNSNVQGVNNSILYNSSATHHDPGVHLSLSRKPTGRRRFNSKTT